MTIRMQESEAAANFQQFLAHLEAGDQVSLSRDGKPDLVLTHEWPAPSRLEEIESKQRDYLTKHAPVVLTPDVVDVLRQASADFRSQMLEPRLAE